MAGTPRAILPVLCPTLSDAARAEIVAAVQGVLDHADFAPLFGPDSRPEVPIAARLPVQLADGGEIVISGQVDRLVVTKDEVLIVDYKTNRPAPVDIARTAPAYIRQIAAYRLALATLFPTARSARSCYGPMVPA